MEYYCETVLHRKNLNELYVVPFPKHNSHWKVTLSVDKWTKQPVFVYLFRKKKILRPSKVGDQRSQSGPFKNWYFIMRFIIDKIFLVLILVYILVSLSLRIWQSKYENFQLKNLWFKEYEHDDWIQSFCQRQKVIRQRAVINHFPLGGSPDTSISSFQFFVNIR